jgi:hypothetical protein
MELKIKNSRLKETYEALVLLASLETPRQQPGQDKPKVYKFRNPGQVRTDLARTFKRISEALESFESTQKILTAQFLETQRAEFPEKTELQGHYLLDFLTENRTLEQTIETIDIRQVQLADLDPETNAIPYTIIGVLLDTVILDTPKG